MPKGTNALLTTNTTMGYRTGMDTVKKGSEYMQSGEVARLFGVTPRTVARWVREGRISASRTPGGRNRYLQTEVDEIMEHWPRDNTPAGRRQEKDR